MKTICYICGKEITPQQIRNYQAVFVKEKMEFIHCNCKQWYDNQLKFFRLETGIRSSSK